MGEVPGYVSAVLIITTFAAVAFLLEGLKVAGLESSAARTFLFVLPLWIIFQCVLSIGGFYLATDSIPVRLMVFGMLPSLLFVIFSVAIFRNSLIKRLPLNLLTLTHTVRIPVELVLYWLYAAKLVPREMTFAGWNYDIVSGVLAVIIYLTVFTFRMSSRVVLVGFNVVGLLLLANVVTIAIMSLPTPFQRVALDQPNNAVLLFPYIFLPTIIVPIVLFSHIAALVKICQRTEPLQ